MYSFLRFIIQSNVSPREYDDSNAMKAIMEDIVSSLKNR